MSYFTARVKGADVAKFGIGCGYWSTVTGTRKLTGLSAVG